MKALYYIVIVSMIVTWNGCSLMGKSKEYQPFESEGLDRLVVGKTTAKEITENFGAPTRVVKLSNGNAYVYQRAVAKGTAFWFVIVSFGNYDKQYDRLVFFFDEKDTLTHYGVSLHANESSYGLPF